MATDPGSRKTAQIAQEFIAQAEKILAGEPKANGLTMRGFSVKPALPTYREVYGLRAAAIAVYPMYKGLARLVGMEIVGQPKSLAEEIDVLERAWGDYDFFFVHFKYTDSRGEDGNFAEKVKMIEQFDAVIPRVMALQPTVLAVTGDHSTPGRHGEPQLASRAGAPFRGHLPPGRLPGVRRDARPSAAASGTSRRSTSCRWPSPTPGGWPSSGREALKAVPRCRYTTVSVQGWRWGRDDG